MYDPKDFDNLAGWLFSWLQENGASLIDSEEYYDRSDRLWSYEAWQLPDGELVGRLAIWYGGVRPDETRLHCDSLADFRQYVREEIQDHIELRRAERRAYERTPK